MKKFAIGFGVTMFIFAGFFGLVLSAFFVIAACADLAETLGMPDVAGGLFGLALCVSVVVGIVCIEEEEE